MGHLELTLSKLKECNVDWVKVNREKRKGHVRSLEKR
jgi:hypothetical protein